MQQVIEQYHQKIGVVKDKSLSQIAALQTFIEEQFTSLKEKIIQKIDKHNQLIEYNIAFYDNIPRNDIQKGYFGNMLQSQLMQEITVFEVEELQQASDSLNIQPNGALEQEDQSSHQQKQLKEVYSILKKAIHLFSEQYSNSISPLNQNLVDFSQKKIEYQSDFCLSQDRQHANIVTQTDDLIFPDNNSNNIMKDEAGDVIESKCITIEFKHKIDLSRVSPSHLPPQYQFNHVKCFSVLDDNRRAVLCTRNNLVLFDLQQQRVIKYTQLRGAIPTLPTCIQPLYSYEYEFQDIGSGQFVQQSINSKIINNEVSEFQNNLYAVIGSSKIKSKQENNSLHSERKLEVLGQNSQQPKRERRQNLIAVGLGSLSQTIEICIFNLKNLQKIIRLPGHLRTVCKLIQPSLDYETLFSISSDKKIFVWNLTQVNPVLIENTGHSQSINDAFMINERQLSTFSLNGEVYLWDIEYTQDFPQRFKNLKKKMIIQRSCLSLYIGQIVTSSDRHYFSITSQGIIEQKYYLEMNDYSNKIILKQELPHKVVGINILSVNMDIFVLVTYSSQNYFEVYKVATLFQGQKKVSLFQTIYFTEPDKSISTVIETPRVQFIERLGEQEKMQIALALDENIVIYSVSLL